MDFLTIDSPHTGVYMNILVTTDHFTQYAKAIVIPTQMANTTAIAFWNEFITNYGLYKQLLTDQDNNFESQLIKELCSLASIQKVQTTPYHT